MTAKQKKTIEIGDDIATVVRCGVRVTFNDSGAVSVYGDVPVTLHPPANNGDAAPRPHSARRPGDRMEDGTIYVGTSPDTGRAFYAAGADEPRTMTWGEAILTAVKSNAHGLTGWRLPTGAELNAMFESRDKGALRGTFNETAGSGPSGWYWSSTGYSVFDVYGQRFSDGLRSSYYKFSHSSVRLVRS